MADPDAARAQVHRNLLEGEGLTPFVARDGEEARGLIGGKGAPALALVDLSLARLDGFAVIKLIRARAPREKARVVALSSAAALRTTAQQRQGELQLSGLLASWASAELVAKAIRKALAEPVPAGAEAAKPEAAKKHEERKGGESAGAQSEPLELDTSPNPFAAPEPRRLLAIEELIPSDRPAPEELQKIVEDVARRFGVSGAFVSVVLKDRQRLRASTGMKGKIVEEGTSRTDAFCTHVVEGSAPLVVPDAAVHPYFMQNPLVKEGSLRSYAGAPLVTANGEVLGSLCIIDQKPLTISAHEVDELVIVARQVAGELELARARREQASGKSGPFTSSQGQAKPAAVARWFDAVLDNIEEGVVLLDEHRKVMVANRAAARLLETTAEALIGVEREALVKRLAPRFANPAAYLQEMKIAPAGPYALRMEAELKTGTRLRWTTRPVLIDPGSGHLIVISEIGRETLEAPPPEPPQPEAIAHPWRISPKSG